MKRAVFDQSLRGGIERFGQLTRREQRLRERQRASLAAHDVQRIGGEVILREVGDDAVETGRDGSRNRRMSKPGVDQALEFADQLMDAFGRQVEPEDFDGDQPIALRFIRAKHRTQSTGTDLMEHAKWTEGVWRARNRQLPCAVKTPQEGDSS